MTAPLRIAVIGAGISGLSAAWLLARRYQVTLYEADARLGGHAHTRRAPGSQGARSVDTGFIIYNELNYPLLTALFAHLGVATKTADMSFGVSLDDGALEYASNDLGALFAQRRNMINPRFWSMLLDLLRFCSRTPHRIEDLDPDLSLGAYLAQQGYGRAFQIDHLFPQACAIWSAPRAAIEAFPASAFLRFYQNHGLLRLSERPAWRTVIGGSSAYVAKLAQAFSGEIRLEAPVQRVERTAQGPMLWTRDGAGERYDHIVIAAHAPQALGMLTAPSALERALLGAFSYSSNIAWLHSDPALMPTRRRAWASWNYVGRRGALGANISYWMNRLQGMPGPDVFVSLNPTRAPRAECVFARDQYEHPVFDRAALAAQGRLSSLQGIGGLWYCGAYFGAGFHEDGLRSGLDVADRLAGMRPPWEARPARRLEPGANTALAGATP